MSTPEQSSQTATVAPTGNIRLLIEQVVRSIVDTPDEVVLEETPKSGGVELEIQVAPKDIGKVIGKQGRTIRSLRTLAEAAGLVQNVRVALELREEEGDEEDGEPQPGNVAEPEPGNQA